jgi:hypothetical protein
MASTAYSGTINDSPWSGMKGASNKNNTNDNDNESGAAAVVDEISPFEKRLNETSTSRAGGIDDPYFQVHTTSRLSIQQQRREICEAESSCRMTTIRCAVHVWIWTDLLLGVVSGFYGLALLLRPSSHHDDLSHPSLPVLLISLTLTVAALLLSRFIAASLSLWVATDNNTVVCGRYGLLVSAYIAPLLSIVYVTTFSVVAAAGRGAVVKYLHSYHLTRLLTKVTMSTPAQFHGLLTVLLVLAVTECIQWQVYQEYRRYLLRKDAFELLHPPAASTDISSTRQRQPWWWQSSNNDDTLTRHLLEGEGEDNEDVGNQADISFSGQPRWALSSPFGPGRRRRRRRDSNTSSNTNSRWWGFQWKHPDSIDGGHDVRDDGSVDFAEVQEEWASRTEEDPFWWSRPEDHGGHGKNGKNHTNDTSWAEGKDDEEGQRDASSNRK